MRAILSRLIGYLHSSRINNRIEAQLLALVSTPRSNRTSALRFGPHNQEEKKTLKRAPGALHLLWINTHAARDANRFWPDYEDFSSRLPPARAQRENPSEKKQISMESSLVPRQSSPAATHSLRHSSFSQLTRLLLPPNLFRHSLSPFSRSTGCACANFK